MGKTYSKNGYKGFRRPKGFKQAKINGSRKAPPTDWDDVSTSDPCRIQTMVKRMMGRFDEKTIIDKVVSKLNCPRSEVSRVVAEEIEYGN
jgi:hypothetical protein